MTPEVRIPAGLALLAILLAACGGESYSDCDEVNEPVATQSFGESCTGFWYGSCPTFFHDCLSGVCADTKTTSSICTTSCASDAQCPSGWYCRFGGEGSVCTPPATCTPFWDGTCNCDYSRDPADPTECLQGSCTCF